METHSFSHTSPRSEREKNVRNCERKEAPKGKITSRAGRAIFSLRELIFWSKISVAFRGLERKRKKEKRKKKRKRKKEMKKKEKKKKKRNEERKNN